MRVSGQERMAQPFRAAITDDLSLKKMREIAVGFLAIVFIITNIDNDIKANHGRNRTQLTAQLNWHALPLGEHVEIRTRSAS
jgi:hypothetical protein